MLFMFSVIFALDAQTILKVGDKAPEFKGKDQDWKEIKLGDYAGKKLILYFYPKDNTNGCTQQACNLRDNIDSLSQAGYFVLGISTDGQESHKNFKSKHSLPFPLLADEDYSIHDKYGVWKEKERDGKKVWGTARTTFIIDEKGIITKIINSVNVASHADQILKQ
jgi:peroxiredoxin Q/BCP